jgi:hypothetical protein
MEDELLKLERAFADAISKNDLESIGRIVADDWIIVDPNGEIVDRTRFFEVIKSGALTHDNNGIRRFPGPRLWGKCSGHRDNQHEGQIYGTGIQHAGAGYRCLCKARRPMAMRANASHPICREVSGARLAVASYQVQRQILRCLLSPATVIHNEG